MNTPPPAEDQGPPSDPPAAPADLGDFFTKAPVLTCRATPEGYLSDVGGPWTETLGWSAEELTSRPFFDFIHPDDIAATTDTLTNLNDGINTVAFVNRYRTVDGDYRYIRWYAHVLSDLQIYAVAIDVTHEVQQDIALKFHSLMLEAMTEFQEATIESDFTDVPARLLGERLRQLTGAGEVLVASVADRPDYGPVLAALSATPAFAAVLDHHSEATAGTWTPGPSLGFLCDLNTLVGAVVRTGEPVLSDDAAHDVRRSARPGGEPQLTNLVALPLHGDDGTVGVIALGNLPVGADPELHRLLEPICVTVANAVERVAARERHRELNRHNDKATALLRAIAEDSDTLLIVTHADESVYFLNAGAERLLGVSSPDDDPDGSRTDYMEAYRFWSTDPDRVRAEWTFMNTDGTRTPMLVSVTALYDADGQIDGWVHMGTSLADRHEAEQTRTEAALLAAEVDTLRDRERELGLLSEATEYVMSSTSLRDALQVIRTYVPAILGAESLDVLPVSHNGPRAHVREELHAAIVTDDCWALRTGRAHLTRAGQAARCRHLPGGSSHLCVPLTDGDRVVAVLSTRIDLVGTSEREATARAEDVARQMGVALANLTLRKSLEQQATVDVGTGIANRRAGERELRSAVGRNLKSHEEFGLLMIDLDRFKLVNDKFKDHSVGDRVLRDVAKLLRGCLREGDTVARMGGEEFLVVLRNISYRPTLDVAEALRRRVEDEVVVADGWNCTVSIGALHVTDASAGDAALLAAADRALYRAKENGRNQVVVAGESDVVDLSLDPPPLVRLADGDHHGRPPADLPEPLGADDQGAHHP